MDIAIIGGGIAGILASHFLQSEHKVTLYESCDYFGGHAHTVNIKTDHLDSFAEVGTEFFYPYSHAACMALFRHLEVPLLFSESNVTFHKTNENLMINIPPRSIQHYLSLAVSSKKIRCLYWLYQFFKARKTFMLQEHKDLWDFTFDEFLHDKLQCPRDIADEFIFPFFASCWGAPIYKIRNFPVYCIYRSFCYEQSLVLKNGVASYINILIKQLNNVQIRLNHRIVNISKSSSNYKWLVKNDQEIAESFDQVIFATPVNVAANILSGSIEAKELHSLLSQIDTFSTNIVIHSDHSLMPAELRNYSTVNIFSENGHAWTTVWSGRHKKLPIFKTWLPPFRSTPVSLHHQQHFQHFTFHMKDREIQKRIWQIQGKNGLWLIGMYTGGIDNHESAVLSAVYLARMMNVSSDLLTVFSSF